MGIRDHQFFISLLLNEVRVKQDISVLQNILIDDNLQILERTVLRRTGNERTQTFETRARMRTCSFVTCTSRAKTRLAIHVTREARERKYRH